MKNDKIMCIDINLEDRYMTFLDFMIWWVDFCYMFIEIYLNIKRTQLSYII